jgi:hypothetical protein
MRKNMFNHQDTKGTKNCERRNAFCVWEIGSFDFLGELGVLVVQVTYIFCFYCGTQEGGRAWL